MQVLDRKAVNPHVALNGLLVILGSGLGVVTAYLVVTGSWHIALGLIFVLPAVILLHKYPFLAVIVWLVLTQFLMTTPSAVERNVYWLIHRALPPATVGIIVVSHVLRINHRKLPKLGLAELAMAGYLAVSFVSIITLNDDPQATAFLFFDRVFSPMCLYLIVRLSAPDENDLQRLMPVVFFLGVSQSLIGILSWFAPQVLPSAWLDKVGSRTTGSLINTSNYSIALIFAGLLLLQAAINRKPGLVRTLYLSAFVLTVLCDFLSFSRAGWLAEILVILGLIYLYPKMMLRLGLVALPVIVILAGGPLSDQLNWANERLSSEQSEESALSRLPVYYAAYRMFQAQPVLGWGYGNFDRYDRQFQGRVADLVNAEKDHASHNFYLTLIAEQGLIGFSLYLAPFIALLIRTLKTRSVPRMSADGFWSRKLLIVFWLIVLNYIVVSNFSNMRVVYGLGLWWITLGLIADMVAQRAQRAPDGLGSPAWARRAMSLPTASATWKLTHMDPLRRSK